MGVHRKAVPGEKYGRYSGKILGYFMTMQVKGVPDMNGEWWLYRSTDAGKTWIWRYKVEDGKEIGEVVVRPKGGAISPPSCEHCEIKVQRDFSRSSPIPLPRGLGGLGAFVDSVRQQ